MIVTHWLPVLELTPLAVTTTCLILEVNGLFSQLAEDAEESVGDIRQLEKYVLQFKLMLFQ